MADADGATKFADVEKVEAGLHDVNIKPVSVMILASVVENINVISLTRLYNYVSVLTRALYYQV